MVTINIVKKRRTKHTYLRVLDSNLIQISTNIYFTKKRCRTTNRKQAQVVREKSN